jgi:hypothetical protein
MATPMVVLALALLAKGWLGLIAMSSLALLEHGLMMPAMLVPMLLRLDLHTGRAGRAQGGTGRR